MHMRCSSAGSGLAAEWDIHREFAGLQTNWEENAGGLWAELGVSASVSWESRRVRCQGCGGIGAAPLVPQGHGGCSTL